jgi:hypothetical protein
VPANVGSIVAVSGRDPRDVWMVSASGDLLRWDGRRLDRRKAPSCPSYFEYPQGDGRRIREVHEPRYRRITLTAREAILSGPRTEVGTRGSWQNDVQARGSGSRWSCDSNSGIYRPVVHAIGDALIRLQIYPVRGLTIDGRPAPFIGDSNLYRGLDFGGRAPDDLWAWNTETARVWKGNGVAWYERPVPVSEIRDVWIDETGSAFVLGNRAREKDAAEVVVRWDDASATWKYLPFTGHLQGAKRIVGASARDVWVLGDAGVFHWDGRSLRRAPAPMPQINDAWVSRSGELWIAGEDPSRKVKLEDDEVGAGMLARMPAEAQPR